MSLIIMIPILLLIASDGWQLKDNFAILITVIIVYLNYKDASDTESEDYYGGY